MEECSFVERLIVSRMFRNPVLALASSGQQTWACKYMSLRIFLREGTILIKKKIVYIEGALKDESKTIHHTKPISELTEVI